MSNPVRILIQRVLWDKVCDIHDNYERTRDLHTTRRQSLAQFADEFLTEPADHNAGFLQAFDAQIGSAVADDGSEFESCWHERPGDETSTAIVDIAGNRYGLAGRQAALDVMDALLCHREQTVGERGVW